MTPKKKPNRNKLTTTVSVQFLQQKCIQARAESIA